MYLLAILIGVYAYGIFFLGIYSLLFKSLIITYTFVFIFCSFVLFKAKILQQKFFFSPRLTFVHFLFLLIVIQAVVNLIGVFGPELSFDALWYHLTIPKIYLQESKIFFIPGGLLYYSAMPKLIEMIYVAALAIQGEVLAKLIHFMFGVLVTVCIYVYAKKYLKPFYAAIASVLFYSNLVVGWESITAFVDLGRAFFEFLSFFALIIYYEKKQIKWVVVSAAIAAFSVGTKLLSIGSVIILFLVLVIILKKQKQNAYNIAKLCVLYLSIILFVSLPWFAFAFTETGNPVYPLFSPLLQQPKVSLNIIDFLIFVWNLFLFSSDRLNPIYLFGIIITLFMFKKMTFPVRLMILYCFAALILCFIIPYPGAGRFILPYLPVFSIVVAVVVSKIDNKLFKNSMIVAIIIFSFFSILYRSAANFKYVNVLLGKESVNYFLTNHLNFNFGDFYDTDGYFRKNIMSTDKVLVYGVHNLYYINFPYVHSSWVKKGDKFNYVLVQDVNLPQRFADWRLVYKNSLTNVMLYSKGGAMWQY